MTPAIALWAQVNPMDFGRNFRAADEEFHWSSVVLVVAIIVAICFAVWLGVRYATDGERRGYRNPRRLFQELCAAHELDRHSRALLMRLAAAHTVAPAVLFLNPERFDATQLDAAWLSQRSELERLRDTIFGRKLHDAGTP